MRESSAVTSCAVLTSLLSILLVLGPGCAATAARAPQARGPAAVIEPDAGAQRLVDLIRDRLALAPLVARAKWNAKLPVQDPAREAAQLADLRARAVARGLAADWVEAFFRAQIEAGKQIQAAHIQRWEAAGAPPFAGAPDLRADLRPKIDALNQAILDLLVELGPRMPTPKVQAAFRPQRLENGDVDADVAARALAPLIR
jgi:chorismate mutase